MNVVVIVFLACVIEQPDHCEDTRLQFAWQGSLRQCVMAAQPYLAQWIGDHPQWIVKAYHCEYPHTRDKADASGSMVPNEVSAAMLAYTELPQPRKEEA